VVGFGFGSRPTTIGVGEAIDRATGFAWLVTHETVTKFARIFDSKERKEISGVVGVSDVAHQTIEVSTERSLLLLAVVSLSLGLINLFPFLPLDGGHIFWSLVEKVRGRRVPFSVIERASAIGFLLILLLFAVGLTNDLGRLGDDALNPR
jgi:regulator of sigma E protease